MIIWIMFFSTRSLWKPPIKITLTEWKYIEVSMETIYITSVNICNQNLKYKFAFPFSKYIEFYSTVCKHINSVEGMINKFPESWLKETFFGLNDDDRNERKQSLDRWFQELTDSPKYIFNDEIRYLLYQFVYDPTAGFLEQKTLLASI
jgi:hypothetical protein